ncbi:cellulose biosynthesis protein BcsC [Novosphingobium terrae]|uniref:cellulose biosynthesis protein BcsC n=1 Tax=Novosphingobium terrae TaxID=2726189 RepID=UPI001F13A22F|nr:cellulose biosynthesis protein BcsC [Novosphingobium terrae]
MTERAGLSLNRSLIATGLAMAAPALAAGEAHADAAGVKALQDQARYWEGKGRHDLATQAWHRVLEMEPGNAMARSALAGGPVAAAAPAAAPAPAPAAPRPVAKPAQPRVAARVAKPERAEKAERQPTVRVAADAAGQARVLGYNALRDNDLDTAQRQFQFALSRNSRDADALGGMGLVYLKRGRFGEARDALAQAGSLGDAAKWTEALSSARYFADLQDAQAMVTRGQLDSAQRATEALIRSGYSQNGSAMELLANIYEKQGRYADAADMYRQAGQGSSAGAAGNARLQSRALRGTALADAARGDDLGAEQAFQQGLMLDPSDPWIRYEFARFMQARGRAPEADSLISSLSASTDPDALYAAAMLNADAGRGAVAQGLIDRIPAEERSAPVRSFAIGLKVDNAVTRAKAIAAQGQRSEAIAALRQLGTTQGVAPTKQAAIADALNDLGDSAGAANMAQQALNGQVTELAGYEAIMRIAARTGRDDLARTAMARASQLAAGSPDGQRALGRMGASAAAIQADRLRNAGQYAQAFDVLQAAYAGAPDNMDLLGSLARLYQSGRMNARAAQTFQIILTRDPRNRDALSGLMETAQAAGDKTLSQQAERDLLSLYGDHYETYLAAARTEQARGNAGNATRYFKQARDLYTRGTGVGAEGSNPFAASPFAPSGIAQADNQAGGGNPFRNQPQAQAAPATPNPFALGNGTRLSTPAQPAYTAPAYQSYQPTPQAYQAPGNYAQTPAYGQQAQQQAAAYVQPASYPQSQGAAALPVPAFGAAPVYGDASQPGGNVSNGWGGTPVGPQVAPDGMPQNVSSDPVLAGIEKDIAGLAEDKGPRAEVNTSFRSRAGETGLSQLDEIKAEAKLSTGLGRGRVFARAEEVVIDAGRPTGSSLARFGTNATIEAQAIVNKVASQLVNAETQRASGVAVSAGYADKLVQIEGGTTPIGMGETKAVWRAEVTPKLSDDSSARLWFKREAVTDSVLSYAGTRDPVTGQRWGQVMRMGGGAGYSYDRDGNGAYGDVSYNVYRGDNVRDNHNVEVNVGGYLRAWHTEHSNLSAGINVNYQAYGNNQNEFTWGSGGYFSPQSFLAIGFPINYTYEKNRLTAKAGVTPGFQTFSQNQTNLYPTDDALQGTLNTLKAQDSDVRNYYDSLSKTSFGMSAQGSLYYAVSPATRIGGEISYNSFGTYDEVRATLGLRQTLGSSK